MGLHEDFPVSPFDIIDPSIRWFPADESLRDTKMERLIPPLVAKIRKKVKEFRDSGYVGASVTSKALLNWWFNTSHVKANMDGNQFEFKYYFAQREAIESIIYLFEVAGVRDKFDMMRFDMSGELKTNMFDENWLRFVIKMATGSGKTKILSLVLAWSYFHKLYEQESQLARNFLIIAPNIIVLDRLYKDFNGLNIFFNDPIIPFNGYCGKSWISDFQLTLHVQDDVRINHPVGNVFLTNIHRVYYGEESTPSSNDDDLRNYFLGPKPTGATTDSKMDLGKIVRDIEELMILNDEAHHIHDSRMAWFKSIEDINKKMLQKGLRIPLQVDVSATPKHDNGAIFVQTISDYPLVEAISQNVVKRPILPDIPSRERLIEHQSSKYTEKYADYIHLGVIEWRKTYQDHQKLGKKSILFIMTDETRNCDEVAKFLEENYHDLKGAVLTIHTKNNGEISEAAHGKAKEELEKLREQANSIDSWDSPYKAIVSVMMLKEGWDVRNVTTIVGLRAYTSKSNILPEQTLGRGLRKMHGELEEYLSVVGTPAFMTFVESIQAEGVLLERRPMGAGKEPISPTVIEVDKDNLKKDMEKLDIVLPLMTPRVYREYKNIESLSLETLIYQPVTYKNFSEKELRDICFKDIVTGDINHVISMETEGVADYRRVIGFFAKSIMEQLRLVSGYDALYLKIKLFINEYLFGQKVELEDLNTLRNLSETIVSRTIIESFKNGINELTVMDKGDAEIRDTIKLRETRPFIVNDQQYIVPKKSVFNRIVGDSYFELQFASFLENCNDIISYAKNYLSIRFKLDYVNANGDISNYYPDFFVKVSVDKLVIVETKGLADMDVPLKMARLKQWCEDINSKQKEINYDFAYVDQKSFEQYRPTTFKELLQHFKEYKNNI